MYIVYVIFIKMLNIYVLFFVEYKELISWYGYKSVINK